MKKSALASIVALLLTLSVMAWGKIPVSPAVISVDQTILNSIFIDGAFLPYQVRQTGDISGEAGLKGYYALLTNPVTGTDVILIDIRQATQSSLYVSPDLIAIASRVLARYREVKTARIKSWPLQATSRDHLLANLEISSPDGGSDTGFIGQLKYPENRYIILLLIAARKGRSVIRPDTDTTLRAEANELLPHIRVSDRRAPSELYMRWRLQHIYSDTFKQ